jgi:hypothetical protein
MRSWVVGVACASAAGCVVYKGGDDTGTVPQLGQLDLTWQVGSLGCESAGVTSVEVDLGGTVIDSFACANEAASISVDAGTYTLTLRGLDVDGVARYSGDGGTVTVYGGQTSAAPTVLLSALPATINTTWYFENGRLCSANGVNEVELNLFDEDDTLQASMTSPCDAGELLLEDIEAGTYVLLLFGLDEAGVELYNGTAQIAVERGDDLAVDVMLVSSTGGGTTTTAPTP